jgi:hypothetical protein
MAGSAKAEDGGRPAGQLMKVSELMLSKTEERCKRFPESDSRLTALANVLVG